MASKIQFSGPRHTVYNRPHQSIPCWAGIPWQQSRPQSYGPSTCVVACQWTHPPPPRSLHQESHSLLPLCYKREDMFSTIHYLYTLQLSCIWKLDTNDSKNSPSTIVLAPHLLWSTMYISSKLLMTCSPYSSQAKGTDLAAHSP